MKIPASRSNEVTSPTSVRKKKRNFQSATPLEDHENTAEGPKTAKIREQIPSSSFTSGQTSVPDSRVASSTLATTPQITSVQSRNSEPSRESQPDAVPRRCLDLDRTVSDVLPRNDCRRQPPASSQYTPPECQYSASILAIGRDGSTATRENFRINVRNDQLVGDEIQQEQMEFCPERYGNKEQNIRAMTENDRQLQIDLHSESANCETHTVERLPDSGKSYLCVEELVFPDNYYEQRSEIESLPSTSNTMASNEYEMYQHFGPSYSSPIQDDYRSNQSSNGHMFIQEQQQSPFPHSMPSSSDNPYRNEEPMTACDGTGTFNDSQVDVVPDLTTTLSTQQTIESGPSSFIMSQTNCARPSMPFHEPCLGYFPQYSESYGPNVTEPEITQPGYHPISQESNLASGIAYSYCAPMTCVNQGQLVYSHCGPYPIPLLMQNDLSHTNNTACTAFQTYQGQQYVPSSPVYSDHLVPDEFVKDVPRFATKGTQTIQEDTSRTLKLNQMVSKHTQTPNLQVTFAARDEIDETVAVTGTPCHTAVISKVEENNLIATREKADAIYDEKATTCPAEETCSYALGDVLSIPYLTPVRFQDRSSCGDLSPLHESYTPMETPQEVTMVTQSPPVYTQARTNSVPTAEIAIEHCAELLKTTAIDTPESTISFQQKPLDDTDASLVTNEGVSQVIEDILACHIIPLTLERDEHQYCRPALMKQQSASSISYLDGQTTSSTESFVSCSSVPTSQTVSTASFGSLDNEELT